MKVALKFNPFDNQLSGIFSHESISESTFPDTDTSWYLLIEDEAMYLPKLQSTIVDFTENAHMVKFTIEEFEYNIGLHLCTITVKINENSNISLQKFEEYIKSEWIDYDELIQGVTRPFKVD